MGRSLGSPLLGTARLAAYLVLTLPLMPVQALLVALRLPARTALPLRYHRLCTRLIGIEMEVVGRPTNRHPALFVANHSSYLDIIVLGALIPGSFVAKTEVGRWPFFGWLAKLQRTVFVDRRARNAARHGDDMKARLEAGDILILFPEGTSSDGNRVLPFKSALFAVAGLRTPEGPLTVQPVSIAGTKLDGIPLGRWLRHLYAWYGDMELAGHLWRFLKLGRVTVRVEFHEPVDLDRFPSRKALADHCWRTVAAGVERAVAERPATSEAKPSAPSSAPGDAEPAKADSAAG